MLLFGKKMVGEMVFGKTRINTNATSGMAQLVVCLLCVSTACADTNDQNSGDVFRDCPDCPEMVVVPSGSFLMGDIAGVGRSHERPAHRVVIPEAFAVGRFEVTVGEFRAFVKETNYRTEGGCNMWSGSAWINDPSKSWQDPGFVQSDLHAVGCINWNDAKAYADWLARKTSQAYRLLSEAEWEYAQRAGTTTLWFFGDNETDLCRYGNIRDDTYRSIMNTTRGPECDDGVVIKAPVGSYQPNGFGIYDMIGNVYEWAQDCWNDSYAGAPINGMAWMSGDCSRHALRGGSWPSRPWGLRSAFRNHFEAENRSNNFGFRIAKTISP